jgi:amidase
MAELWQMGAADLAATIRDRKASSREVVEAHLRRIGEVNPGLNAVTVTLSEQAFAAADEADRALARGAEVGLLHGVPMTVKENVDLTGSATTWGTRALAQAMPSLDAPHVAHLKQEGAIPIGRTNLPDFALRWHTDSGLHGPTRNPWDAGVTPGGSSGGEAASLATGMTPLGVGNDLGGSLRWPSQCCGTATIRPTLGRVPHATVIEPEEAPIGIQLMGVQGPMARHVRDVRLALEIMSRPSARDPWYVPAPLSGPPPPSPVRVAVVTNPCGSGVDPDVEAGVRLAADALSDAGYAVEEVEPPDVAGAATLWTELLGMDVHGMEPVLRQVMGDDAQVFLDHTLQALPASDPAAYAMVFMRREAALRAWSQFLQQHPIVLAPLYTARPFAPRADLDFDQATAIVDGMRMVVAINLLGLPSAVVPVGTAGGLPQSVQLIGARYREDVCLDAAEAIEERHGVLTPIDPR